MEKDDVPSIYGQKHLRVFWLLDRFDVYCSFLPFSPQNPVANASVRNLLLKINRINIVYIGKACSEESILDKGIVYIRIRCLGEETNRMNPRRKEDRFRIKSNQDKLLPSLGHVVSASDLTLYIRRPVLFSFVSYSVTTIDRLRYFLAALPVRRRNITQFQLMKNISQSGLCGY